MTAEDATLADSVRLNFIHFSEAPRVGQQVWITLTNQDTGETWHVPATALSVSIPQAAGFPGFFVDLHVPVSVSRLFGEPQP